MCRRALAFVAAACVFCSVLGSGRAATPDRLRIDARHRHLTWSGGPLSGIAPPPRTLTCAPEQRPSPGCDSVELTVALTKRDVLNLELVPSAGNAIDVLACPPEACTDPANTADYQKFSASPYEGADAPPNPAPVKGRIVAPQPGVWKIRADCVLCVSATYTMIAWVSTLPSKSFAPSFRTTVLPGPDARTPAGAAEPGIHIGRSGEIWIDGPGDAVGDFWSSYDGGRTFALHRPAADDVPNTLSGAGDTWTTIGPDGTVYADVLYASLGGGNVVYVSRDRGATWSTFPGPAHPIPSPSEWVANIDSDRQWLTADPRHAGVVYFTYHDLADGFIWVYASRDFGVTWAPLSTITGQELRDTGRLDTFGGNSTGPIVVARNGDLFFTIGLNTLERSVEASPARRDYDADKIYVVRSADGGRTWHFSLAHDGRGREYVEHGTIPLAIDRDGTIWVAYSSRSGPDGAPNPFTLGVPEMASTRTDVYLISSRDGGRSWTRARRISDGRGSNVFPTMAAGNEVKVAWLDSTAQDFNDRTADWRVVMASAPRFGVEGVSPGFMHHGDICQSGTQCAITFGNRSLLDFIWMETDARGTAHVVYADDLNGTVRTVHAVQTG